MTWVAVAIAGSAAVGAIASKSAADKQAKATREASAGIGQQSAQTREDLAPWREAGLLSLRELQSRMPELTQPFGMEQFQESPAYQFNLQQGQKAIEKAAAKRGTFYAPATLQDIGRFSQGLASNEFQNAFSNYQTNMGNIWQRLYGMSGTGQSAANQTGAFGAAAAGQIGENTIGAGNAAAAGRVGAANALSGGVSDYYNTQLLQGILARNQQSSVSGPNAFRGQYDPGLS